MNTDMQDFIIKGAAGNPGALTFLMEAIKDPSPLPLIVASSLIEHGITGSHLYMFWNDCCGRDMGTVIKAGTNYSVEELQVFIEGDGCRGTVIYPDKE